MADDWGGWNPHDHEEYWYRLKNIEKANEGAKRIPRRTGPVDPNGTGSPTVAPTTGQR